MSIFDATEIEVQNLEELVDQFIESNPDYELSTSRQKKLFYITSPDNYLIVTSCPKFYKLRKRNMLSRVFGVSLFISGDFSRIVIPNSYEYPEKELRFIVNEILGVNGGEDGVDIREGDRGLPEER